MGDERKYAIVTLKEPVCGLNGVAYKAIYGLFEPAQNSDIIIGVSFVPYSNVVGLVFGEIEIGLTDIYYSNELLPSKV